MAIFIWRTIPLLAFSLVVFACDSTTSNSGGTTKTTARDVAHPCQLLTLAQIQAAVGVPTTDNQSDTVGDMYFCYYGADYTQADGVPNLSFTLRTDNSILADGSRNAKAADHYNIFRNALIAGKTTVVSPTSYYTHLEGATEDALIEEVSGLGSSAFYYEADKPSIQLWVLKDYAELSFLIHLPANGSGSEKERLKTVASQFIAAMP